MLFIPQEIKEKLVRLEADNKQLLEENNRLKEEVVQTHAQQKSNHAIWYVVAGLILAIAYIIFLHVKQFNLKKELRAAQEETTEATVYRDGDLVKWNAADFEGVVYRVQLGAYEGFDLSQYKENMDGLHQEDFDGYSKITLGAFSKLADAQKFLQEMLRLELKNAFIVAYKNNEPIGLIEAKNQE